MRIVILMPDSEGVSGGIAWANRLYHSLKKHGHEVLLTAPNNGGARWLVHPCPAMLWDNYKKINDESDVILVFWNGRDCDFAFELKALKRFYICLGHSHSGPRNGHPKLYGEQIYCNKEKWPWDGIACISEYGKKCFEEYGWDIKLVTDYIERDVFHPTQKEPNTVAYFPRRNGNFVERVLMPKYQHLSWVPIEKMNQRQVAETLGRCEYFVACSMGVGDSHGENGQIRRSGEGWSGPPFEAMASGCLVCGYKAMGSDYMTDKNCYLVPDYDEFAFIFQFENMIENKDGTRQEKLSSASKTIDYYDEELFYQNIMKVING